MSSYLKGQNLQIRFYSVINVFRIGKFPQLETPDTETHAENPCLRLYGRKYRLFIHILLSMFIIFPFLPIFVI